MGKNYLMDPDIPTKEKQRYIDMMKYAGLHSMYRLEHGNVNLINPNVGRLLDQETVEKVTNIILDELERKYLELKGD